MSDRSETPGADDKTPRGVRPAQPSSLGLTALADTVEALRCLIDRQRSGWAHHLQQPAADFVAKAGAFVELARSTRNANEES